MSEKYLIVKLLGVTISMSSSLEVVCLLGKPLSRIGTIKQYMNDSKLAAFIQASNQIILQKYLQVDVINSIILDDFYFLDMIGFVCTLPLPSDSTAES